MFKFNNRNTRKRCEICSKLTIKLPEPCQWRRFGVFIVNFEHILHLFLVFFIVDLKKKVQRGNEKKNTQMNLGILTGKQHLPNIGHNYGYRRF